MKTRTAIAAPFMIAMRISMRCASLPIFFPLQFFDVCLDIYKLVVYFKSFFLEIESPVHAGKSDREEDKNNNCNHAQFLFLRKWDWC